MKYLLDAHGLIWFLAGDARLSGNALACIQDTRNALFVSPATLWEIGIKDSLGKLVLPERFEKLFPAKLEASSILILPILIEHLHQHRLLPYHPGLNFALSNSDLFSRSYKISLDKFALM